MIKSYKLYDDDPYIKSFQAKILNVQNNQVILDQTAFYPEGGGQVGDTGFIGRSRVVDTQKNDGSALHILETKPNFKAGDTVECKIDWDRRYRIMRLHSAAHIMEYFLWKNIGKIERLGSRVDEQKDRADYAYNGRLPPEGLKKTEIEIHLNEENPEIRIWRCGPMEMLCGGTHVKNTSEIGNIKLKRKNPGRGTERVETILFE